MNEKPKAKRKTLEERLAGYKAEAIMNSDVPKQEKEILEDKLEILEEFQKKEPAKECCAPTQDGWPKAMEPVKECCMNSISNALPKLPEGSRECCKNDRLISVASRIIQGIYAEAGIPRKKTVVNKDVWVYLEGKEMDLAMGNRADIAIKQAKILLEKL